MFCILLSGLAGCAMDLPGDRVGVFSVRGSLEENACGAQAVPAFESFVAEVDLRTEADGRAYWARQGSPMITGTGGPGLDYAFAVATTVSTTVTGCSLLQGERISATVQSVVTENEAVNYLSGVNTVTVAVAAGGNCAPLLVAAGGPFEALPCDITYSLSGEGEAPVSNER